MELLKTAAVQPDIGNFLAQYDCKFPIGGSEVQYDCKFPIKSSEVQYDCKFLEDKYKVVHRFIEDRKGRGAMVSWLRGMGRGLVRPR